MGILPKHQITAHINFNHVFVTSKPCCRVGATYGFIRMCIFHGCSIVCVNCQIVNCFQSVEFRSAYSIAMFYHFVCFSQYYTLLFYVHYKELSVIMCFSVRWKMV